MLAAMGSPMQPSYGHLKLLGRYYNHVYHQSQNIGQLTWKKWDDSTDYNESVYNRELNELLSYLQGSQDLNYPTRPHPGPSSLLNPEIVWPEEEFQAAHENTEEWTVELRMYGGEIPSEYEHDQLKAQLDWHGDPGELDMKQDKIDKIDHEAMYSDAEDDPSGHPPDLEECDSVDTSVYDQLEATPASTAISTDTEVAGDMLNLTMGQLELPAPQETHDSADDSNQDDNPLEDMFQVPTEALVFQVPLPAKPRLDPRALMVETKFKSGWRTLLLSPGLRRHIDDSDSDTRNMVLQALQMPMVTDTQGEVANPRSTDPLDLDRDANRDEALQVMQERHRRESRSSSVGSHSSSRK